MFFLSLLLNLTKVLSNFLSTKTLLSSQLYIVRQNRQRDSVHIQIIIYYSDQKIPMSN